jgi:hypothetical protein
MIMKKTFLTLFALIAMSGSVMAGDKPVISVADVEALPGETVSFTVNLVDGKADTYTAMTLFAYFPTEGFTTTGNKTVANTWDALGSVGNIDSETGLATIPLASEDPIPGSAVEGLVTVSFTVADNVAPGEYEVTLKETMFEYNTSDKDYADDVTFKVNVVEHHNVVLDEESTDAPIAATDVNVKVKRTIKANSWSTICLPFAIPEANMETAFGTAVLVKDFIGYTYDEEKDELTINFTSVSSIEANHPYLIKVTSTINEFTINGIDIDPVEAPMVNYGSNKKPKAFVGTYVANFDFYGETKYTPLFISDNKFYYATEKTLPMKAFRAYFEFVDELQNANGASARISMVDNKTTGIKTVHGSGIKTEGYYDLQGRKIENPKKGLYINNGKKVVIK